MNRIESCEGSGIAYEPDQRHAALIVRKLGFTTATKVTTPGVKEVSRSARALAGSLSNADGSRFPRFSNLSEMWDKGAEYVALFPNVLLGVHNDHYFNIILTPDGTGRTNEQIEIYYADKAALGEDYAAMRAINTEMWKTVFSEDIHVVEGMHLGRSAPGYNGGKFSAVMDESTHHFHKWVATNII